MNYIMLTPDFVLEAQIDGLKSALKDICFNPIAKAKIEARIKDRENALEELNKKGSGYATNQSLEKNTYNQN